MGATKTQHQDSKRDLILEAAAQQMVLHGLEKFTLEGVAEAAGVSKGGLLYHFPSREALIEAMARCLVDDFAEAMEAEMARERTEENAPEAGRVTRAYVRLMTTPDENLDALIFTLIAAPVRYPVVTEIQRGFCARWHPRIADDGIPQEIAELVRLAADGCWMAEMFGFSSGGDGAGRMLQVREALLRRLAEATVGINPPPG